MHGPALKLHVPWPLTVEAVGAKRATGFPGVCGFSKAAEVGGADTPSSVKMEVLPQRGRLSALSFVIVHACTLFIVHACTLIMVHAWTVIVIIVHECTMVIVRVCNFGLI